MSFVYLATPYTKYPHGIDAAFVVACEASAVLIRHGVPHFCPIAMTHPVAIHGGIDPYAHDIWLPADKPFMAAASGIVMLQAESWEQSYGMKVELETFQAAGKPVFWMTPGKFPEGLAL